MGLEHRVVRVRKNRKQGLSVETLLEMQEDADQRLLEEIMILEQEERKVEF